MPARQPLLLPSPRLAPLRGGNVGAKKVGMADLRAVATMLRKCPLMAEAAQAPRGYW